MIAAIVLAVGGLFQYRLGQRAEAPLLAAPWSPSYCREAQALAPAEQVFPPGPQGRLTAGPWDQRQRVRICVVSAKGSSPRCAARAPAPSGEPVKRAWPGLTWVFQARSKAVASFLLALSAAGTA